MYSVFLHLIITCVPFVCSLSPVTVSTRVGAIAGLRKELDIAGQRKVLTEFLGIPYGEDTSGQNRFKRPIPKATFNTTYNAFELPPPCMQFPNILSNCTTNMTEDCLMLNIYVPRDIGSMASPGLLPVMIWIHGGAYVSGAAREYNGEVLSFIGDVIVVTINYRLLEYGFLNVGDSRASGNQGLWDQHLAIKWVKNNIAAFQGDSDEITIFGESAGSVSVTYQSLYAGNKGLFKRVIAESGSALAYWALDTTSKPSYLYKLSGCDNGSSDPVECLRRLSTQDFYQILLRSANVPGCCSRLPTVDHDFVIEKPSNIVFGKNSVSFQARQFFRSLDILTGVNNGEGALYIVTLWMNLLRQTDMNNLTVTQSAFKNSIAPGVLSFAMEPPANESRPALAEALTFEYVYWSDPNNNDKMRERLVHLSSDLSFFVATVQLLEAHSSAPLGRSYLYEFVAEPPIRLLPTPVWFRGANHVDEIEYVFGGPFQKINTFHIPTSRNGVVTQADKTLALGMMTAWSNFAKSRLV